MNLSTIPNLIAFTVILHFAFSLPYAQGGEPWTAKQLKDPAELAAAIQNPKGPKVVILNVGPVEQIKGAIQIGPTSKADNLKALRQALGKVSKDQEVVVYCGCCPLRACPNLPPAFEMLKELKVAKAKVLNLPTSLNADWVDKGYPME